MKENLSLFERAKAFIRAHHRRSVWYRIISVLGVFVVFVTTYMLVLPAITMVKGELICGMEEHVHNSDCYTTKYTFTCGQDEESGHEHTDDCITSLSVLTCQIPEHYHEESCYAQTDDTPDAPAPASAEITPAQAPASDDGELVIDNTPEQEALPELPTEPETTAEETETETETEAEPADTLAWDSTTEPVRFGIRLKLKEGAFAEGSVLDVEYLDEAKAAPYIETLKNQLASAQEGQDADAAVLLPVRATVRDASGNALPMAKAELSIYMEDLAGTISEDTLLFANYDAQGVTWEEEEYDRIPADEAESEHLQADVDAAGVFVLADVRYTERAAATEQPTEAVTEQATEAATEQATEAATEKATEAANASGAQQNNPSANSWGGFGGAGIEEPGIGGETGRTFVQNADGTLQEAGQPGTETEETKETDAQTETESGDETDAAETEDESESETENKSETEAPAGDFAGGNYMGGDPGLGFEDNGELTQGKEPEQKETENGNETGAQYMYICGLAEHTHTEECYDEDGNLVCGLEEHTHTEACVERPMADETQNGVTRGSGTDLLKDPNTKISGSGTDYNPETGEFKTDLRFDYKLTKSDVMNTAQYEYYINIPDDIIVPEKLVLEGLKTFNDINSGKPAGQYEFVKDANGHYSIKIHFDPGYVMNDAGDTLEGFVEFEGFLKKESYEGDGNLRVEFEDNQKLEIPTKDIAFDHDETVNYDIDISKDGYYEIKGNKLVYKVIIKSLKGTPDPIKFEDVLTANGLTITGAPSVKVQKGVFNYHDQYYSSEVTDLQDVSVPYIYDGTTKTLSMQLDKLEPGTTITDGQREAIHANAYVITYEYPLADLPDNLKLSADNTAKVESRDTSTGELVTDSSSKPVDVNTEMTFTKSGWYNSGAKSIEWTLTLNSNKLNIAGATVEDTKLPKSATDITVDPDEGWELGTDGKIHFTGIGDTGVNTNKYTIKYKTPVETTWDGTTVENSATFDWDGTPGNGDEKTASQKVTTNGGSVNKELVDSEIKTDNTTVELTWKTKIVVPDGGLPADIVLTDSTLNPYNEDGKKHYMTPAQIEDWVESIKNGANTETINWPAGGTYEIIFTDEGGKTYSYDDIQKPENADVHIVKFEIRIKSFPASATGEYWFTYNTTADLTGAQRGANTYYNNVEIGGKKSTATYTFREGGVDKTDGNHQSQTTDVTNDGTLSWRVKASIDSRKQYKELKIVDELPEHILLSEIEFDYNKLTIKEDGTFEGTVNSHKISGRYDRETGKIEVIITRENPDEFLDPNKDFEILYTCSVDKENLQELEDGQKYEFTNKVTVYKDGVGFGTDSQTQNWTEQVHVVEEKKVEKLGVWDNDNRQIDYEVVINPKAEDLVPNSDELTLTDTLTYVSGNNEYANFDRNVSLIQGTVKLYEAQKDASGELVRDEKGKLKKGELVTDWEWVYSEKSEPDNTWGDLLTNTITGKIPDEKALILVYSYRVQMNYPPENWYSGNDGLTVRNQFRINGTDQEDSSYNYDDKWEKQSSSAGVKTDKNYTFYKVEKGSYGVALKDAKFSIYEVNGEGNERKVTESTTDTSGKFQIVWKDDGPFKKNTLYYAVEEEAPNGYIKPENPPKYYFYFGDGTTDLPDNIPAGAVNLSATSHVAYIENEKNDTDIEVDKKWLDADGNDVTAGTDGKVEFNLYRKESLTPPNPSASEESSGNTGSTTGGSSGGSNEIVIQWDDKYDYRYHTGFKANPGDKVTITLAYDGLEACTYGYNSPSGYFSDSNRQCDEDGKIRFTVELGEATETVIAITESGWGRHWIEKGIFYDPSKISFRIVRDEEGSTTPDPDFGSESGGDSGEDPSEEVVEGTLIGTYSIEKASNWIWRSKDVDGLTLPKVGTNAAGETVYYTYYIKEANAEFYNAVYSANNTNGIVSGTITVTNKKPEKELIGLSVKKQWDDKGAPLTGEHKPIHVELWKKGNTDAENHGDEKINEQELNTENGWTYSWTDLDADAEYYVKEVDEITGYDVTYSVNGGAEQSVARDVTARPGNDNPTLVIKNTLRTTSVEVKKVWLSADGTVKDSADADAKLPKITVHLYKENTEGGYVEVAYVELGKDYAGLENYTDDGWGYTWPNLPEGEYYVEEDRIEGYTVTYHSETMAADATEPTKSESKGTGSEVTVTAGSLVITNTENPTQIEVEKVWTDGNDRHNGGSVTMELYSSTTPPETEAEPKEPEPGTGGTDPVEPEPNPEQTETDSEKPEPVIENVTINIAIDEWLPSGSAAPSNGWAWVGIFECDQTGYVSSYDNSVNLIYKDGDTTTPNLEPENGWHRTVTLPGKITTGGTTEIKYYKIVIDDTPNIDDNGIDYSDSNPLRTLKLKTGEIVNGANGNANVNLAATLASESGGTGGTEGSGGGEGSGETGSGTMLEIVHKNANRDADTEMYDLIEPTSVYGNEATVKIALQSYLGAPDSLDGQLIPGPEEKDKLTITGPTYNETDHCEEFKVTGLLNCSGTCVLEYKWGSKLWHYIDEANCKIVSFMSNTIATSAPGLYSLGSPVAPISLGSTEPLAKGELKRVGTVTLNSGNNWRHTWDNLPKTDEHGNPLYYYVKETDLGEGYTTTYDYQYVDGDKTKGISKVIVTNTPPEKRTTSVGVHKVWQNEKGELKDAWLDSIQVELLDSGGNQVTGVKNPVTLNAGNNWSYNWTDLPEGTYYVQEVNADGMTSYTVKYSNGTESITPQGAAVTAGTITITNQSTSVSVDKKWIGKNGDELTNLEGKEVKVQLYKVSTGGVGEAFGEPIILNGTETPTAWHYEWPNLPLGEYYVVEESQDGFLALYTNDTESTGEPKPDLSNPENAKVASGTITITNYENTEFDVQKVWKDVDREKVQNDVYVQLYSSTTPPDKSVTAKTNNVNTTMKLGMRISNWVDSENNEAYPTGNSNVWMTVQPCDSTGEPLDTESGTGVVYANSLSASNNWRQITQELPATVENEDGTIETQYYLLRFGANNTNTTSGIQDLEVLNGPDHSNSIMVSGNANENSEKIFNIQATVAGADTNQPLINTDRIMTLAADEGNGMPVVDGNLPGEEVAGIDLPKEKTPVGPKIPLGNGKTLDTEHSAHGEYSDGGWHFIWKNLPTRNEKGEKLYYYVEEVDRDAKTYTTAYEYQYKANDPQKGIELVTITNTMRKISITAKKVWKTNGSSIPTDEEIKNFRVTLDLIRDDGKSCGTNTLSNDNWQTSWGNLEVGHSYHVVESSTDTAPYTFTCEITYNGEQGDHTEILYGDDTVTVTNTYNPNPYKLPETGGTGTLPYTVGGALLTALATLLLYIQNKRRKEGQGTS